MPRQPRPPKPVPKGLIERADDLWCTLAWVREFLCQAENKKEGVPLATVLFLNAMIAEALKQWPGRPKKDDAPPPA